MDFFEAQDQARSRSKRLVLYFFLAVGGIVAAVYLAVTVGFFYFHHEMEKPPPSFFALGRFLCTASIVSAVIGLGALWKITKLRKSGGAGIAKDLGGRRIPSSTQRPDERKLLNVVEEMAIAAGLPVPKVYVMDKEPGINAFAAGFSIDDAVVGVTRGAIEQLDRDELQGVIAHEFSHILNGDMRLSTQLSGWIYGIMMLTLLGRGFWELLKSAGDSDCGSGDFIRVGRGGGGGKGGGKGAGALIVAIIIVAVLITVIGFIGELFARLIQAAVSRQREYLADAAAVQFTRNPEGIGNALRRIGGRSQGSRVHHSQAGEFAHAFFGNSSERRVSFFATHPPLPERIRKVLPDWKGDFLPPRPTPKAAAASKPPPVQSRSGPLPGMGIGPDSAHSPGDAHFRQMLTAGLFMRSLGQLQAQGQAYAASARKALHDRLSDLLETDGQSPRLLLALLLEADADRSGDQHKFLKQYVPDLADELPHLAGRLHSLPRGHRLILLEILAPRLTEDLIPPERSNFAAAAEALARADGRISAFELACLQVLQRQLFSAPEAADSPPDTAKTVQAACTLATRIAHETPSTSIPMATLLAQASRQAPFFVNQLKPVEPLGFDEVNAAFTLLGQSPPGIRQQFLQICERIVAADEQASIDEVELLRAIAFGLGVPAAPIFPESEPPS